MANDYARYGLTYQDAQTGSSGDENGNGYFAGREAGFTDAPGNFYTENQASSLVSNISKGNFTAAGGNADMYVDYNALKADPAQVSGALTRAQWDEYAARFQPVENRLMGMSIYGQSDGGAALINNEITSAIGPDGYVKKSLEASKGQAARSISRYGMAPTAEQQTTIATTDNLTDATATVDAANRTRQRVVDRSNSIATGVTPNAGRAIGLRNE